MDKAKSFNDFSEEKSPNDFQQIHVLGAQKLYVDMGDVGSIWDIFAKPMIIEWTQEKHMRALYYGCFQPQLVLLAEAHIRKKFGLNNNKILVQLV